MSEFHHRLVLNDWLLRQLGIEKFDDLSEMLHHPELSGITDLGHTRFLNRLLDQVQTGKRPLNDDVLREYDLNIVRHWRQITEARGRSGPGLQLLYFQWIALLVNEIYQDAYWRPDDGLAPGVALCKRLNEHLHAFNQRLDRPVLRLPPFEVAELNKLAFWMATGSGKTLLMHAHLLQTFYWLDRHGRRRQIEQVILLTPNARLSTQHKREFDESGIAADLFSKSASGQGSLGFDFGVQIVDIHKLKDKSGEETIDVAAFEGRNLVLVDEGHRGASGVDWLAKRKQLCEQGFSYEYSATFEQAVAAAKKSQQKSLAELYAKCIALDYSYKWFYHDGYGKDYRILNLQEARLQESRDEYLTGCLLAFYQQCRLYAEGRTDIAPYLLADPLAIFVGGTVTGQAEAEQQSDMVLVVELLASVLKEPERFTGYIDKFLTGGRDLLNGNDQPVFANAFDSLIRSGDNAETIYADLCARVFHAQAGGGLLHIDDLKGADGELGLKVGNSEDYFAVINVGDSAKLRQKLEDAAGEHEPVRFTVAEKAFSGSLFTDLNKPTSKVRLLIGAKKFTEGWSSWRVSTMGLLNIGKNKGSEIIQLFGRGVRLKGYDFGLQRSGWVTRADSVKHPEFLHYLETLNVFGVRADYMDEFKRFLDDQGMDEEPDYQVFKLPVVPTPMPDELLARGLQILRPKADMPPFKQHARPVLGPPPKDHKIHVTLDWYPRVTERTGDARDRGLNMDGGVQAVARHSAKFGERQRAFLNWDQILFELVQHKNDRAWHNLQLHQPFLKQLLSKQDWYTLYVPESEWDFGSAGFAKVRLWQEIAVALLKKYIERFYLLNKQAFEEPHLEYQTLSASDSNFVNEYQVLVPKSETGLIEAMKKAEAALKTAEGVVPLHDHGGLHLIGQEPWLHLYFPLVHLEGKRHTVKVLPQHLNDGEALFVRHIHD